MATSRLSGCCLNRLAARRLQRTSNVWRISSNVWRLSSSRAGKTASLTGLDRLQGTVKGLVQGSVGALVQGTVRNFLQGPLDRLQGRLLALLQVQGPMVQCTKLYYTAAGAGPQGAVYCPISTESSEVVLGHLLSHSAGLQVLEQLSSNSLATLE